MSFNDGLSLYFGAYTKNTNLSFLLFSVKEHCFPVRMKAKVSKSNVLPNVSPSNVTYYSTVHCVLFPKYRLMFQGDICYHF